MKWTYTVKHKLTAASLLFGVILLVMATNVNQRSQIAELETAFEAIYRDRLVAESYILNFSEKLHLLQLTINEPGSSLLQKQQVANQLLSEIDTLNRLYQETRLTEEEAKYFLHFTGLTKEMDLRLKEGDLASEETMIQSAFMDLHVLSQIQLAEADKIKSRTDRIFHRGSLVSQLEMVILIVMGLLIQALLFTSSATRPSKWPANPRMN
ncbi:hypothetical protein [Cyclobacterium xiamenense]|uniref:hypothetical protein n=1 Tax=Cyclobacterium xiamenense TaxID=1297121 RepID=UPI0035D0F75D